MTTTPTLGLTQFEATDTINFLTQYNTDLSKIDTNAKMTKAIGSDYIYSYTTAPSYTGGTVTIYSGTKYVCADGRDANGDIKQTVYTLTANKTNSLTGTRDFIIFLDHVGGLTSIKNEAMVYVDNISKLPTTVSDVYPYVAYVFNEHRYFLTTGSTTANWQVRTYCKIASVRVASSTITYFKPNLQLNLAQKIGKDKLLMTMAEVNANTDKEFVPSAVAVKELKTNIDTTYGVDYIVEKGSNANGNYEKWNSGKLVMWGKIVGVSITFAHQVAGTPFFDNTLNTTLPLTPITTTYSNTDVIGNGYSWSTRTNVVGSLLSYTVMQSTNVTTSHNVSWHVIGTWK